MVFETRALRSGYIIAIKDLSFAKAFEIAQSLEAAERDAKALKEPAGVVQKVCAPTKHSLCVHCGGRYHFAKNCRYSESVYHNCGKKGHIVRVCPTNKAADKRRQETASSQIGTHQMDGR